MNAALDETGRQSNRHRDLPAHAVAYSVMALSLYRGVNSQGVRRVVAEGLPVLGDTAIRRDVGQSGISAARPRLGWQVLPKKDAIYNQCACACVAPGEVLGSIEVYRNTAGVACGVYDEKSNMKHQCKESSLHSRRTYGC